MKFSRTSLLGATVALALARRVWDRPTARTPDKEPNEGGGGLAPRPALRWASTALATLLTAGAVLVGLSTSGLLESETWLPGTYASAVSRSVDGERAGTPGGNSETESAKADETTSSDAPSDEVAEEAEAEQAPVEVALAVAHEQLGKPYRYGSTGPSSFDCSGFTSFVWRAAGIEIPRTSRGQFGGLPRVGLDELQPGDLLYSPGHIGLYIGDGKMIHSPHSGRVVEISPLRRNLTGAVRPAALAG